MPNLRVAVYIDGFNVYYRLKKTQYKWLDYRSVVQSFLRPNQNLEILKYFTARVNGTISPGGPQRQDAYLRALQAHIPEIQIFEGTFLAKTKFRPLAAHPAQIVEVLDSEEKGSDVNLAVHLLNDACQNLYDIAFVMSNDSDLAEAIRLVHTDHKKPVGLIVPGNNHATAKLRLVANPVLTCRVGRMGQHQLPDPIPGTTIRKPRSW